MTTAGYEYTYYLVFGGNNIWQFLQKLSLEWVLCRLYLLSMCRKNKMADFILVNILCIESCDSHVTSSCSGLHIHTQYILIIVWLHVYVHNTHN